MTQTPEDQGFQEPADLPHDSMCDSAAHGSDDRRGNVNPADNPAPSSPAPDKRAVREGEERWDSVKGY